MKKIVLIAAFAASAVFAETAALEAVKDAAVNAAKSEATKAVTKAVDDAVATEANATEAKKEVAPDM